MYVCICYAVTDRQVDAAIVAGADTVDAVGEDTGAGAGCGGCRSRIGDRLAALAVTELVSQGGGTRRIALSA